MRLMEGQCLRTLNAEGAAQVSRLLRVDGAGGRVCMINVFDDHGNLDRRALPTWTDIAALDNSIAAGTTQVLQSDPFSTRVVPEASLSEAQRRRRDAASALIEPYAQDDRMLYPASRWSIIESIAADALSLAKHMHHEHLTPATVLGYFRVNWQAGREALVLGLARQGGKGKPAPNRRGRASRTAREHPEDAPPIRGEELLRKIRLGLKTFVFCSNPMTLPMAHAATVGFFFAEGVDDRGEPVFGAKNSIPTFHQFRYQYQREKDTKENRVAQAGVHRYNLRDRPRLGDSSERVHGAGYEYQIDSTPLDVDVVDPDNRQLVLGRPSAWIATDHTSRAVVGFALRIQGLGRQGTRDLICSLVTPKAALCERLGLPCTDEAWPDPSLPHYLLADRGLQEELAKLAIRSLDVQISQNPPFRPDWKGVVESRFALINRLGVHSLPGAKRGPKERGEQDSRERARLTLAEVARELARIIIYYNNCHRLDARKVLTPEMIADAVEPYPLSIWRWSVDNWSGQPKWRDEDYVRRVLMPSMDARVDRDGIHGPLGLRYVVPQGLDESWFIRRKGKSRHLVLSVNETRVDEAYVLHSDGQRFEAATLHPEDAKKYKGLHIDEVAERLHWHAQRDAQARLTLLIARARLLRAQQVTIGKADKEYRDDIKAHGRLPKTLRFRPRPDRKLQEQKELDNLTHPQSGSATPPEVETSDDYVPASPRLEILRSQSTSLEAQA